MSSDGGEIMLKEYFEKLISAQEKEFAGRSDAVEKALYLARDNIERRLDALNLLRTEVIQDRSQFVQSNLYESHMRESAIWRSAVSDRLTRIETRAVTWTAAIGMFFLIVNVTLYIFFKGK
jgi:hypothetical protein